MIAVAENVAASSVDSPSRGAIERVMIATINREEGDTGVHTHTRMLRDGLADAGVKCDVVSAFGGSGKWLPIFAVRPLLLQKIDKTWATLWHRKWHMAALRENLRRRIAATKPDVILAQCPVSARAALDVRSELRHDIPVAMVCHFNHSEAAEYREKGELAGESRYRAMLEFEDAVLRDVDRVIYVSDWARQSVEQARAIRTRASSVILNGISQADALPLKRDQIGVGDQDIVLMNVGSLEPRKNQLGLLDLFAQVHAQYTSAKLVLIGDGPARGEIEQKIGEMNLRPCVRLLGHRRDVPSLLPLADLYVHYAALENCPLVLIEAARAGLPFAAVPAGGVPELQAALGCKIELFPHDLSLSLDQLRPLLDNAADRRAAGALACERFAANFTRDAMTRAYLEALSA